MDEEICIKIKGRTAKLLKSQALLSDRYSEFPINIDFLYSVELRGDGDPYVTRKFDEVLEFLRGARPTRDFSFAIGFEVQLAAMAARLMGNSRVLGEDLDDDDVISNFFAVEPDVDRPSIVGCQLIFIRQFWKSPDSLIGECERITFDLESGRVVQTDDVPLRL